MFSISPRLLYSIQAPRQQLCKCEAVNWSPLSPSNSTPWLFPLHPLLLTQQLVFLLAHRPIVSMKSLPFDPAQTSPSGFSLYGRVEPTSCLHHLFDRCISAHHVLRSNHWFPGDSPAMSGTHMCVQVFGLVPSLELNSFMSWLKHHILRRTLHACFISS